MLMQVYLKDLTFLSPINVGVYAFTRGISVPRLWLNAMYRRLLEAPQIKRKMFLFLHFREGLPYPVRCHGLPITVVTSLACIFACCLICSFIQCTRRNNSLQITLTTTLCIFVPKQVFCLATKLYHDLLFEGCISKGSLTFLQVHISVYCREYKLVLYGILNLLSTASNLYIYLYTYNT